jgi:hypothetical protein
MALVYDRELNGEDTTWSVSISHVAYLRKLFNFFDAERVVRRAARARNPVLTCSGRASFTRRTCTVCSLASAST